MKKKLILIGIAVLFFAVFFSMALIPYTVLEYDMDIKVGTDKTIGINVGTDAIHFGKVPSEKITGRSTEAVRELSVSSGDTDVKVTVKTAGEMGQWVTADPKEFNLAKNQTKVIVLTAVVPYDTEPGVYNGTVIVTLLKDYGFF